MFRKRKKMGKKVQEGIENKVDSRKSGGRKKGRIHKAEKKYKKMDINQNKERRTTKESPFILRKENTKEGKQRRKQEIKRKQAERRRKETR